MNLRSITSIKNLQNKRVILRLDLNVPIKNGRVSPDGTWRLKRVLPTIKYLLKHKAKIVIISHLSKPVSLRPVCLALEKLLHKKIAFKNYHDQDNLAMLENIRLNPGEAKNDPKFAKQLALLGDVYINDAFGNIHRNHASMDAITRFLPSYAGLLMIDEIDNLEKVLKTKRGLLVILGGAKIATKAKLMRKFIKQADHVLVGGALANNLLKARGEDVGKSLVDKDSLALAKRLLNPKVILPSDTRVSDGRILDIGPKTIREFSRYIKKAKLIIWNGPLGLTENKLFITGSKDILKACIKSRAKLIIGGGETVELVDKLKLHNKIFFVSTGGGAMLAFLQGDNLPVLNKLKK